MQMKNDFHKEIKTKQKDNIISVDPSILETLANTQIILLTESSYKFPKAKFLCNLCPRHMDDVDQALKHAHHNLHKRNLNNNHFKNELSYYPNPTKLQIEAINECLESVMKQENFISKDEYQRRVDICMKMNELAVEINPGNKLVICGSLLTGLSIVDVSDVNLYLDSQSKDTKNTGYLSELQKLALVFKSKLSLKSEIKLETSNCGLFCKEQQGVLYRITVDNSAYQTSELIRIYLKIDSRAEQLAKLFRLFAHKSFIDQTKDGLFPSQTFGILVIFYLQQLRVPILPNLHRLADSTNPEVPEASLAHSVVKNTPMSYVSDLEWIKQNWTPPVNEASLAYLWIGLLRFYVVDFNSSAYMVSIRSTEPVLKADRHIFNKRLAIEDPFDPKRNILSAWNTPDVIDFVNDQLQGGYIYFTVPQLVDGPAFRKVSFSEISLVNMKPTSNVCPIFTLKNFTKTLEVLETEFECLYAEEKAYYDVSRWPAELFVKGCLGKILTAIYNNVGDIRYLITLLEFKTKNGAAFFSIDNYVKFKEYAVQLAKCVLHEFSHYLEVNNLWSQQELNNRIGFELIKLSCQMFLNTSLSVSGGNDILDSDINESDKVGTVREFSTDEFDKVHFGDTNLGYQSNNDHIETTAQYSESWKLPIAFKQICVNVKGTMLSSENPDEYNEFRINSLEKKDLAYNFNNIPCRDKKLVIKCAFCNTKGHRKENCGFAIPRFTEMQGVMETIDAALLEKLRNVLNEKYNNILSEPEKWKENEKIFDIISEKIKRRFPTVRPQMFGSMINGFMNRTSDLDICFEFYNDNKRETLSNKDIKSRLGTIYDELKKIDIVEAVELVLRENVPIVKFFLKNNTHGDISINNILGLQNTKMLKLYTEIDDVVKILGNLIKFMSKTYEIGDAFKDTLSSYTCLIMSIHFLQKRGILPVLQELHEGERPTHIIDGWDIWYQSDMAVIRKLWDKKPVSKNQIEYLWLDFFYYYAVEFDIMRQVVTIRQSAPLFKIDKNWQSSYMAVEDPFELSHNLCRRIRLENCRYILECFARILRKNTSSSNQRKETFQNQGRRKGSGNCRFDNNQYYDNRQEYIQDRQFQDQGSAHQPTGTSQRYCDKQGYAYNHDYKSRRGCKNHHDIGGSLNQDGIGVSQNHGGKERFKREGDGGGSLNKNCREGSEKQYLSGESVEQNVKIGSQNKVGRRRSRNKGGFFNWNFDNNRYYSTRNEFVEDRIYQHVEGVTCQYFDNIPRPHDIHHDEYYQDSKCGVSQNTGGRDGSLNQSDYFYRYMNDNRSEYFRYQELQQNEGPTDRRVDTKQQHYLDIHGSEYYQEFKSNQAAYRKKPANRRRGRK